MPLSSFHSSLLPSFLASFFILAGSYRPAQCDSPHHFVVLVVCFFLLPVLIAVSWECKCVAPGGAANKCDVSSLCGHHFVCILTDDLSQISEAFLFSSFQLTCAACYSLFPRSAALTRIAPVVRRKIIVYQSSTFCGPSTTWSPDQSLGDVLELLSQEDHLNVSNQVGPCLIFFVSSWCCSLSACSNASPYSRMSKVSKASVHSGGECTDSCGSVHPTSETRTRLLNRSATQSRKKCSYYNSIQEETASITVFPSASTANQHHCTKWMKYFKMALWAQGALKNPHKWEWL